MFEFKQMTAKCHIHTFKRVNFEPRRSAVTFVECTLENFGDYCDVFDIIRAGGRWVGRRKNNNKNTVHVLTAQYSTRYHRAKGTRTLPILTSTVPGTMKHGQDDTRA